MSRKNILFVCLGNICRSPSAEAIMKSLIKKEGLEESIFVDSAGILPYHVGEPADARMQVHAGKRGYELTSIARQINKKIDFQEFDYIITMDHEVHGDVLNLADKKFRQKVYRMTDFNTQIEAFDVPDPFYGNAEEFELVLDILEDACKGLLEKIKDELKSENQNTNRK
jgi:protein-tyrosine phosphatase